MMTYRVKAIKPPPYAGIQFRSFTEVRWYIFFNALGWNIEYEKQGFNLAKGISYLPDFWLPQSRLWAEVKGDQFSNVDIEKVCLLVKATKRPCFLLNGNPDEHGYWSVSPPGWPGIDYDDLDRFALFGEPNITPDIPCARNIVFENECVFWCEYLTNKTRDVGQPTFFGAHFCEDTAQAVMAAKAWRINW